MRCALLKSCRSAFPKKEQQSSEGPVQVLQNVKINKILVLEELIMFRIEEAKWSEVSCITCCRGVWHLLLCKREILM